MKRAMTQDLATVRTWHVMGRAAVAAATVATLTAARAQAQAREPFPGLDAYVASALKAWNVPGLGLAIVRNDSVIYARGYGVRDVARGDKVTEQTVFAIGSSSKAFTAAAVAMLVDEKKVYGLAPKEIVGRMPILRDVTIDTQRVPETQDREVIAFEYIGLFIHSHLVAVRLDLGA